MHTIKLIAVLLVCAVLAVIGLKIGKTVSTMEDARSAQIARIMAEAGNN